MVSMWRRQYCKDSKVISVLFWVRSTSWTKINPSVPLRCWRGPSRDIQILELLIVQPDGSLINWVICFDIIQDHLFRKSFLCSKYSFGRKQTGFRTKVLTQVTRTESLGNSRKGSVLPLYTLYISPRSHLVNIFMYLFTRLLYRLYKKFFMQYVFSQVNFIHEKSFSSIDFKIDYISTPSL